MFWIGFATALALVGICALTVYLAPLGAPEAGAGRREPRTRDCLFHAWRIAKRTPVTTYLECALCGARKVEFVPEAGYQPIDHDWLQHRAPRPAPPNAGGKPRE